MADVELVVRIPEEEYNWITKSDNTVFAGIASKEAMMYAIKNGTILPKGHGRLGDLDAICKDVIESLGIKNETFLLKAEEAVYKRIKNASTIVEADTQNKEKEDKEKEYIMPYITGATLLSVKEAKNLNEEILKADYDWWLDSRGYDDCHAACVDGDNGYVIDHGCFVNNSFGVRPALIISDLESFGYKIGEFITFGEHNFTIISDRYALCDDMIGECAFRKDSKAKDANEYETSDIKRYVETWFEKVKEQSREGRDSEEEREF